MNIQIPLKQFYDYSSFIRGYTPATINRYKRVINAFCRFAQISELEQVSPKLIKETFMRGRSEKEWKANTYVMYHKTLTVFFRWCIENDYTTENLLNGLEMPKIEKSLPPKLTKQDAQKLLEYAYNYPYDYEYLRHRNHAIFSMFLHTGLRKKKLLNLKLSDVDMENLTVYVRQGKGSKGRIIPMSSTLHESLTNYLKHRKRLNKTCPEFFTSLNRDMGFTDIGLRNLVRKIRDASGIKFHPHQFRHTFACNLAKNNANISLIQATLGHKTLAMTERYLRSIKSEDAREYIDEL